MQIIITMFVQVLEATYCPRRLVSNTKTIEAFKDRTTICVSHFYAVNRTRDVLRRNAIMKCIKHNITNSEV
jgi:hypothetical protein